MSSKSDRNHDAVFTACQILIKLGFSQEEVTAFWQSVKTAKGQAEARGFNFTRDSIKNLFWNFLEIRTCGGYRRRRQREHEMRVRRLARTASYNEKNNDNN